MTKKPSGHGETDAESGMNIVFEPLPELLETERSAQVLAACKGMDEAAFKQWLTKLRGPVRTRLDAAVKRVVADIVEAVQPMLEEYVKPSSLQASIREALEPQSAEQLLALIALAESSKWQRQEVISRVIKRPEVVKAIVKRAQEIELGQGRELSSFSKTQPLSNYNYR